MAIVIDMNGEGEGGLVSVMGQTYEERDWIRKNYRYTDFRGGHAISGLKMDSTQVEPLRAKATAAGLEVASTLLEYQTRKPSCGCPARQAQPSVECRHMTERRLLDLRQRKARLI